MQSTLFHNPTEAIYHLIKKSDFNGEAKEDFLTACPGTIYIISDHGLFRFQNQSKECTKIASTKFLEKQINNESSIFARNFNEGTCYKLQQNEINEVINSTKIECKFKNFYPTEAFQAVYHFIIILSKRSTLLEDLNNLSNTAHDNQSILDILPKDDYRALMPALLFNAKDLSAEKFLVDSEFVIDQIRALTKGKTPAQIAVGFEYYCGDVFNDSVLAEMWHEFAKNQLNHFDKVMAKN